MTGVDSPTMDTPIEVIDQEDFSGKNIFKPTVIEDVVDTPDRTDDVNSKLNNLFSNPGDNLFFVKFTPSNTLRPKWFLVQISALDSDDVPLSHGHFFCTFLHKHPKDSSVADNKVRWWPEWRELLWDDEKNYEFGDRILFGSAQKPDLTLFGKFGTELNFNTPGNVLVGPFSFMKRSLSRAGRCFVSDTHWKSLNDACQHNSLTPPTLSNDLRHVVTRASILRSTLNEASSHCEITEVSSLTSMLYIFCKKR